MAGSARTAGGRSARKRSHTARACHMLREVVALVAGTSALINGFGAIGSVPPAALRT